MKKNAIKRSAFLLTAVLLLTQIVSAQKVNNPKYLASSNRNVHIEQIEITDDNTIVELQLTNGVEGYFMVPSTTYITSAEGGEDLTILKAKGVNLDCVNRGKDVKKLQLYFPPISDDVSKLNFRSGSDKCNWNFYEIDLKRELGNTNFQEAAEKSIIIKDGKEIRLIENPQFKASSSSNLKLKSVEMTDEATILSFAYTNYGGWFLIPRGSCIQEGDKGKPLFVEKSEGVSIGTRETLKGLIKYKLIFPPISKDAQKIHFKENNAGGSWFIFDIDVSMD